MRALPEQLPDGYLSKTPIFQFILLSCLFPLWAVAASLNDILITQFKGLFELTNFASALVQSAFYGGYFVIAIPASIVIKRSSYKKAIIIGLAAYMGGCALFFPASHMATYTMFLGAIFSIAIGLSFLETASNTYSSMLGPKSKSTLRLNISQTFYPIGAMTGILLGKYLIFSDGPSLESQMALLNPEQLHAFKLTMLQATLMPYRYLIGVIAVILLLIVITPFPDCKVAKKENEKTPSLLESLKYLKGNKRFKRGIATQFIYVGMQVAVWSFTIRLALELIDINEREATNYMVYSFICFFIGKFVANILMTKFKVEKVLMAYSVIGTFAMIYIALVHNVSVMYMVVGVSILFGPNWPTIYAVTLDTVDNEHKETAGAVIVMAIVGAAFVPAIQGYVADSLHSMQLSFFVDAACFIFVGCFFYSEHKAKNKTSESLQEYSLAEEQCGIA
ncbi:MAG: FHS family L-fucose permease-like MFS transporter [Moritella sp.]|jgi:FHS family L-fucose permease-like MFS transporter